MSYQPTRPSKAYQSAGTKIQDCDTCNCMVYPDLFGNTFSTCSGCVANRWLKNFILTETYAREYILRPTDKRKTKCISGGSNHQGRYEGVPDEGV